MRLLATVVFVVVGLANVSFAHAQTNTPTSSTLACNNLSQRMQAINNKSLLTSIHRINDDLKQCVPNANNSQLLAWIVQHANMYSNFTSLPEEQGSPAFDKLANKYQGGKVDINQFKGLTPREKYLAQQLGNTEINLYYEGEGIYSFWYNLATTADIFTPYLSDDQAIYIKRLATDNQTTFWNDAGITITYAQLIERALFWENFVKKYPTSKLKTYAQAHYRYYRYYTFFGSENTSWTIDDKMTKMEPADFAALLKLVRQPNSELANMANQYLKFLKMSQAQRDKAYPVSKLDDNDSPKDDRQISQEQLKKALKISERDAADAETCSIFELPC